MQTSTLSPAELDALSERLYRAGRIGGDSDGFAVYCAGICARLWPQSPTADHAGACVYDAAAFLTAFGEPITNERAAELVASGEWERCADWDAECTKAHAAWVDDMRSEADA